MNKSMIKCSPAKYATNKKHIKHPESYSIREIYPECVIYLLKIISGELIFKN